MFSFAIIKEVSFCASNFSKHLLWTCVKKEGQEILVTCSLAIPVGYSLATVSHSLRPQSNHCRLQSNYSRPQYGYSRPQSGYRRLQSGYSRPQSDHSRLQSDYSRPQNGYTVVGHSLGTAGWVQ